MMNARQGPLSLRGLRARPSSSASGSSMHRHFDMDEDESPKRPSPWRLLRSWQQERETRGDRGQSLAHCVLVKGSKIKGLNTRVGRGTRLPR